MFAARIVTEALTNALRHAGPTPTRVHGPPRRGRGRRRGRRRRGPARATGGPREGSGLGLVGMRERAALVGGAVEAGPAGGGWRVAARLPRRAAGLLLEEEDARRGIPTAADDHRARGALASIDVRPGCRRTPRRQETPCRRHARRPDAADPASPPPVPCRAAGRRSRRGPRAPGPGWTEIAVGAVGLPRAQRASALVVLAGTVVRGLAAARRGLRRGGRGRGPRRVRARRRRPGALAGRPSASGPRRGGGCCSALAGGVARLAGQPRRSSSATSWSAGTRRTRRRRLVPGVTGARSAPSPLTLLLRRGARPDRRGAALPRRGHHRPGPLRRLGRGARSAPWSSPLAHGISIVLPAAFVLGVVNAVLLRRSGSVWPGVVAHGGQQRLVFGLTAILL